MLGVTDSHTSCVICISHVQMAGPDLSVAERGNIILYNITEHTAHSTQHKKRAQRGCSVLLQNNAQRLQGRARASSTEAHPQGRLVLNRGVHGKGRTHVLLPDFLVMSAQGFATDHNKLAATEVCSYTRNNYHYPTNIMYRLIVIYYNYRH